jgi:hypothetical protein
MRKIVYPLVITMIVALASFTAVMVYALAGRSLTSNVHLTEIEVAALNDQTQFHEDAAEVWAPTTPNPPPTQQTGGLPRITPSTLMIYEYHIEGTDQFEIAEEFPSQFLLNMNRAQLAATFIDWQIISFSEDEVHLRQIISIAERQFTISVYNGFIAVFYDNDTSDSSKIKELTNRPISALPFEEQERLRVGITVTGNDELIRALEDFGS